MNDVKLEDLAGEITTSRANFNIKPYLKDFFGGMVFGAISETVGQYSSGKSLPTPPLSAGIDLFSSAVLTGLSAIPPARRLYDRKYVETGQNVWGGRLTRFTGIFTGLSLAHYFLK